MSCASRDVRPRDEAYVRELWVHVDIVAPVAGGQSLGAAELECVSVWPVAGSMINLQFPRKSAAELFTTLNL